MMDYPIPKAGRLTLTDDGDLLVTTDAGTVTNVIYCGRDGLCITNEMTIVQRNDPPKLRLATVDEARKVAMGLVSFNRVRNDGSGAQEECAWLRGSVTEDAQAGDEHVGQFDMYVRRRGDSEPHQGLIVSDAYSDRTGPRRIRVLMADPQASLKEFA